MVDTEAYIEEEQQQPDPQPKPKKLSVKDFAAKIKAKYPDYKDIDDQVLTDKIIAKYPVYKDQVDLTPTVKKKSASVDIGGSSLEAGNVLSQSNGEGGGEIPTIDMYTTPSGEMVEANPIALSQKYTELSNRKKDVSQVVGSSFGMGTTSIQVDDEEAQKAAKKLKQDFPDVDFEGISNEVSGIPKEYLDKYGKSLMEDRKQNYNEYQREIARLKWTDGLHKALFNSNISEGDYKRIDHEINNLSLNTGSGDYSNQRTAIQSLAKDIREYGGENKDEILKNFATEVSKVYGNAFNNNAEKFLKDTPESKYLNNREQLGLQFLKDIDPEKAAQYDRLLLDPSIYKGDKDAEMGANHLHQVLEETGIGLEQNAVTEEINNYKRISQKNGGLNEEQFAKVSELEKKQQSINEERNELDKKYPDRVENKIDDALRNIMGKEKLAWWEYAAGKTIEAGKSTVEGVWDAVSMPFKSDASNTKRELAIMGDKLETDRFYSSLDKNKALQTDKWVFDEDLKAEIDAIKDSKTLSDEQKESIIRSYLKNNPTKFGKVPISGGKWNLNPSSLLRSFTDLGTSLVPFFLLESATGGGATASATRKFLSTFSSAAATSFHEELANQYLQGKLGAEAYKNAMGMTAISSFAMAGANTAQKVKALVNPETSIGKIILGMSDDVIQKGLNNKNSKAFVALKNRLSATPAMLAKGAQTGAEFELAMTGANELKHQIYHTDIDREENFKRSLLAIGHFSGLGLLGQIGYKSPTEIQKGAGLNFGKNPEGFIRIAEQMKKDGDLSNVEFEHRKDLITKYGDAYKSLPKSDSKGKSLTEKDKADYLYETVIKNDATKGKSDLPPKQAAEAEHTAMVADYKREIILDNPTEKQLNDRKGILERKLEPKKDAEGKTIEIPEKELAQHKAELEAVNDAIENKKSEPKGEPENISQPIELSTEVKEQPTVEQKPSTVSEPLEGKGEVSTVKTKEEGEGSGVENFISSQTETKKDLYTREGKLSYLSKQDENTPIYKNQTISISDLDKSSQLNVAIEDIKAGDKAFSKELPHVIYKDGIYKIADGRHRIAQSILDGKKEIQVNIEDATNHTRNKLKELYEKSKASGGKKDTLEPSTNATKEQSLPIQSKATVKEVELPKTETNDQTKANEVSNPKEKGSLTETEPNKEVPKTGKFEEKARKIAEKIQASELPSWLKIDDQNVKKSGIGHDDLKKALADATIKMGKLLDKGVEFGEAVKQAVEDLVKLIGEGARKQIEEGFIDDYNRSLGEFGRSGVKKEVSNENRAANNLPKVDFPKLNSDVEALNEAKKRVDSGEVNPQDLVDRILNKKEGYRNEDDVMDMQYYAHQLQKKNADLNTQLAEAKTPEEKLDIVNQKMQLSDLIDAQTEAALLAGNKWGKIGNRMQPVINDAGQIFRENKAIIKDAYGGELPPEVKERLDKITKERDEAIAAKEKLEEELKQKMASKGFAEIKKRAAKSAKTKETAEQLKKEEQDLLQQLKDAGKSNPSEPKRSGAGLTDKHVAIIGKLAVNYFKQGVNGLEALVDKIHDAVRDSISGITRKDIRDLLANYDPLTMERETERLNKKADILEDKLKPPTINKKGAPSEPTDFAKPSKIERTFRNNTEWVKANQRVANAEFKMKIEKRKAFESQKNYYQRALMWVGRVTRLSVLSGTHVLEKLAAAATIGSAVKRIPEQTIGAVYSQIFKGIAQKAPIEGFLNAKSEAKFYKEFFNPKKFAKNAWEILKTGSSPLSRRLGSAEYEHVPILYLPTDTHQIIKDPPKRATFEASFRNGLIWAEKNGLDINDPLVINSLENAAYKRAQYEIFQEQNWLSKKFTSYKSSLEKKGNTGATAKLLVDFMIPVSTVPTNIVRRVVTTSPLGLIRGGKEVVEAYRKGIESLTPDQADHVIQQLKQGTLGTALWLIGWYGVSQFGGLYSQFNPNTKREEGDKESDVMIVGGKEIPKTVQHALPLEVIQMAATARRVFDNYRENKNATTPEALYKAGLSSIGAGLEQIPVISTGVHLAMSTKDPVEAEKLKEDIGRRVVPQIVREQMDKTKGSEDLKYLDKNGLKIVPLHKESLHPIDANGKNVFVTDKKFKEVSDLREQKIKEKIAEARKNGFIIWETGETIPPDKVTKNQLRSWLMGASTKSKDEAIEEIFGQQGEKETPPKIEVYQ